MIQIQWTSAHIEEAERICRDLVAQNLIACATMIPVQSLFVWEGKVQRAAEVKVLLKTLKQHFALVETYIREHCCYQLPEIVYVAIDGGSEPYLDWVAKRCS